MNVLDPISAPLTGIHTIEASAGTGKTYNLTTLYLRMITEKNLPVSRILVVTYTEAAAAELRDRIRRRLRQAYAALETGRSADALVEAWAARLSIDEETRRFALTQVRSAMFGMDEAAIHTIHGFCNRLLRENAFETNVPFNAELITDTTSFREELASDFWRLLLDRYDDNIIRMLLSEGPTRDDFSNAGVTAMDARMATCLAPRSDGVQRFNEALQPFTDAVGRLRSLHCSDGAKAQKRIRDAIKTEALHKGRYSEDKLASAWQGLETLLGRELTVSDDLDALKPFSLDSLEKARRKGAPPL
ncbi:MAG: UvrD-helicase domain-containing protein, partial [Verrucomicrobia bacterium]|nr:UvrD-helicase domain-containing protein [Verrucomicrobiota bacterium]